MQNVLITGASGGIGSACAKIFAENGFRVFVHYNKNKEKAFSVCDLLKQGGADAVPMHADLTDSVQVGKMFDEIAAHYGSIDVLINNAGIAQQKLFTDITEAEWDNLFNVNVKGMYLCTKLALPSMINKKSGSIVNISSMWGITGASCEVHYSAAKAAVIGFTKALAKEVGPSGIRVNCIAPGAVYTEMNSALTKEDIDALCDETPLGRIATCDEIAKAVYYMAVVDSFSTGQVLSPNGGLVI